MVRLQPSGRVSHVEGRTRRVQRIGVSEAPPRVNRAHQATPKRVAEHIALPKVFPRIAVDVFRVEINLSEFEDSQEFLAKRFLPMMCVLRSWRAKRP